ncbi:MAG: hypothetical protein FJ222_05500 [Lentisphaerae bacterium]|nr:hypothetical protein [Lentisphaerota bacterium]
MIVTVLCAWLAAGCVQQPVRSEILVIDPQLCALSDTPRDGSDVAGGGLAYMFCIPDNALTRSQVARIDPSVRFDDTPRGKRHCGSRGVLCVGTTRQPSFKAVLDRLAGLPYVNAITLCPFDGD